jgi:hypothetical protein
MLAVMPGKAYADVRKKMNYQGFLTDNSGNPVNGTKSMTFTIYKDTEGGYIPLWDETHTGVTVTNGIFSVILGDIDPLYDPLTVTILTGERWLGVQVGTDPEMTPYQKITASAFAIRADTADTVSNRHDERLRIVRGTINADGTTASGSGFSSYQLGTGDYRINLDDLFSYVPTVVVSARSPSSPIYFYVATAYSVSQSSIYVRTRYQIGGSTTAINATFDFIAIGTEVGQ